MTGSSPQYVIRLKGYCLFKYVLHIQRERRYTYRERGDTHTEREEREGRYTHRERGE